MLLCRLGPIHTVNIMETVAYFVKLNNFDRPLPLYERTSMQQIKLSCHEETACRVNIGWRLARIIPYPVKNLGLSTVTRVRDRDRVRDRWLWDARGSPARPPSIRYAGIIFSSRHQIWWMVTWKWFYLFWGGQSGQGESSGGSEEGGGGRERVKWGERG